VPVLALPISRRTYKHSVPWKVWTVCHFLVERWKSKSRRRPHPSTREQSIQALSRLWLQQEEQVDSETAASKATGAIVYHGSKLCHRYDLLSQQVKARFYHGPWCCLLVCSTRLRLELENEVEIRHDYGDGRDEDEHRFGDERQA
jgi:hypothetical protein